MPSGTQNHTCIWNSLQSCSMQEVFARERQFVGPFWLVAVISANSRPELCWFVKAELCEISASVSSFAFGHLGKLWAGRDESAAPSRQITVLCPYRAFLLSHVDRWLASVGPCVMLVRIYCVCVSFGAIPRDSGSVVC